MPLTSRTLEPAKLRCLFRSTFALQVSCYTKRYTILPLVPTNRFVRVGARTPCLAHMMCGDLVWLYGPDLTTFLSMVLLRVPRNACYVSFVAVSSWGSCGGLYALLFPATHLLTTWKRPGLNSFNWMLLTVGPTNVLIMSSHAVNAEGCRCGPITLLNYSLN